MGTGKDPVRSVPIWPDFLWHPKVHRERAEETLCFYRLAFEPTYDRGQAEAGIRAACAGCGVNAVCGYQLLGSRDLLLRTWLPKALSPDTFQKTMFRQLQGTNLASIEPFEVDYELRHFAFLRDGGALEPTSERINSFSGQELTAAEQYFADGATAHRDLARRCIDDGLLVDFRQYALKPEEELSVKFIVAVRGNANLDAEGVRGLGREILSIVDAQRQSTFPSLSLYMGSGFAHYLLLGRVVGREFDELHSRVIMALNNSGLRERYSVLTETDVSGQRGMAIAEERLFIADGSAAIWPTQAESIEGDISQSVVMRVSPSGSIFVVADRFVAERQVGKGGMAEVFKAYDIHSSADRALKRFRFHDSRSAQREADALRNIRHPGIVEFIETIVDGDDYYNVMEYIDGPTLRALMDDRPKLLTRSTALQVIREVLVALEFVHPNDERLGELAGLKQKGTLTPSEFLTYQRLAQGGVIHRDVKPENIMLTHDNVVKLVDFNIASPARSKGSTRSGTIGYLAPDAGYDGWMPQDDIFASGVVLYEMLSDEGFLPYEDDKRSGIAEPVPLSERSTESGDLANLVMRACAPNRTDRFASATEMLGALSSVDGGKP